MSAPASRPTSEPKGFRPEIEGLRAVAAVLVASYHLWSGRVSGGVDVFFVVSGYLVTDSLLRQTERDGRLDIAGFWKRLIRRLAPPSFFVLAVVAVAGAVILPRSLWLDTSLQLVASALYVENWLLAFDAVDYLARDTLQSPVQHFWALSIQGQFYLVWPLLLAALLAVSRRGSRRLLLLTAVGGIFAVSLAYSVYATASDQAWAYFDSFARFWEFCLGALLAITALRPVLPPLLAAILGWLALAAIVSCGMLFRAADSFPGLGALWPTLAAVVILLVGSSGGAFGVHRLLASKPMVALGGVSYHLYLWHWPMMIFLVRWKWSAHPTDLEALLILLGAIGLSFLTVSLVEKPVRQWRVLSDAKLLATVAGTIAVFAVLHGWVAATVARAESDARLVDMRNYPGAAARMPGFAGLVPDGVPVLPQPISARRDGASMIGDACIRRMDETKRCFGADETPRLRIALAGASHTNQYLPAFAQLGEEERWEILDFSTPGCAWTAGRERGGCEGTSAKITRMLVAAKPDLVVTTSNARGTVGVPPDYAAVWRQMTDAGIPILAIRDNPSFRFNVPGCVERQGAKSERCSAPRDDVLDRQSPEELFGAQNDMVHFLDLSDYFCDAQTCPAVFGNVLIYRDKDHLTATYVRTLAPLIGKRVKELLPGP